MKRERENKFIHSANNNSIFDAIFLLIDGEKFMSRWKSCKMRSVRLKNSHWG